MVSTIPIGCWNLSHQSEWLKQVEQFFCYCIIIVDISYYFNGSF